MAVPASVIQALETNNIAYQLKATQQRLNLTRNRAAAVPEACQVKSMLLQDAQGQLQLLLPLDHILNLACVHEQFGRNLEPIPELELEALLEEHSLKSVPAFPEWQGTPTIVDASLLKHPTLLLDCGDGDQSVEINLSDFQSIIRSASVGELSAPAPAVPESTGCDEQQILNSLKSFTELRVRQRLEDTLEMPPLSETAQRIIKLRADPDADISDLAEIVELDPSLAAQVVSWAASPYYSAPGKIKSVQDAIVRVLGFDMVLNLSLGLALGNSMHMNVMTPAQIARYWQQAVMTAATVESLVTSIPRQHRPGFGMAYLSGLLHNFGYLVLAEVFPPYFSNLARHLEINNHVPNSAVEQHLLGVSGCQISSWLMEVWNMPEEVSVALRHQNNPWYQGEHAAYAQLIYAARQLLTNQGVVDGAKGPVPPEVYEALHLDESTSEISVANIVESSEDLNDIAEKMRG